MKICPYYGEDICECWISNGYALGELETCVQPDNCPEEDAYLLITDGEEERV